MARKIQVKRGNQSNLPNLDIGEFGFTIDQQRTYIGSSEGNIELAKKEEITSQLAEKVKKSDFFVSVKHFGAVGDGVTDDTAAIQAAVDYIASAQPNFPFAGADLILPNGHKFKHTGVTINTPGVVLRGGGTLLGGKLFIGATTGGQNHLNITIDGIKIEYASRLDGNIGIELGKSRVVTIKNCLFINTDKSVYVAPDVNYGFHDVSQIKLFQNQFWNVNYNIYADLFDDFATNTNRWMTCSDWQYIDNISNVTVYSPIYMRAIDGINISNNTFFHSSSVSLRDLKGKGIFLGESDWVNICNNHIFETGFEAIHLENPKHYIITDNEIAWCGQREPRSSILITGTRTESGSIQGNNISLFTLHAISLESTGSGGVSVKDNVADYKHENGTYFGATALSSITHYNVHQVRNTSVLAIVGGNEVNSTLNITNNVKKRYGGSYKVSRRSHFAGTYVTQALSVAQTAYNLVELESVTNSKVAYDGLVYINARQSDLDDTNTASYILHVSKTKGNAECIQISKAGLTTGGSASHPSFVFDIDSATNLLRVTGVGATVGTFHFYISYVGNIEVIK